MLKLFACLALFLLLFGASSAFAQEDFRDSQHYFDLAEGYFKKGRFEEAIAYYKKSVQINPLFSEAYERLAKCYTEIGDEDNTARSWKAVLDIQKYEKLTGEGNQLEKQGALSQARLKYREAYELIPTADRAQTLLKRVSAKIGEMPDDEVVIPDRKPVDVELPHPYLTAPIAAPNSSGLHSLVYVPFLESAQVLSKGDAFVRFGVDYSTSSFKGASSVWALEYDASVVKINGEIHYGLQDDLEVYSKLSVGSFSEGKNTSLIENGQELVGDDLGGVSIDRLLIGCKYQFTKDEKSSMGVNLTAKLPFSPNNKFLSTSVPDIGFNLLRTDTFNKVTFHSNLGFVLPGDEEEIFLDDIDLKPFVSFGLAGVVELGRNFYFIVEVQGNTNAFKFAEYDGLVLTDHVGLRWHTNSLLFEGTLGNGLTADSGDFFGNFSLGFTF